MSWIYLLLAGCFEIVGVTAMNNVIKYKNVQSYLLLIIGFLCSFSLLSMAMETLPAGLSYAVWTGIGTVGATVVGMLFYGESKSWKRILFISMILAGIIGLKLTS